MNKKNILVLTFFFCVYFSYIGSIWATQQDEQESISTDQAMSQDHAWDDQVYDAYRDDEDWDPIAEMQSFKRYIKNRIHNNVREGLSRGQFEHLGIDSAFFYMSTDILESEEDYVFFIDMPGMKKEDIDLRVKDGLLYVAGERTNEIIEKKDTDETGYTYARRERRFGAISRQLILPKDIQDDKVTARYDNGVLVIIIPKIIEHEQKETEKKIPVL
jgi:HSP20 family protein